VRRPRSALTAHRITICDAKYAPPKEAIPTTKEIYPAAQWTLFFEQLRSLTVKYIAFVVVTFIILNGCLCLPFSFSVLVAFSGGVTWWRNVNSAWDSFIHYVESDQGKQVRLSHEAALDYADYKLAIASSRSARKRISRMA
jgi:hypothetical protein